MLWGAPAARAAPAGALSRHALPSQVAGLAGSSEPMGALLPACAAGEKLANEISSNSKRIVQATKEALEKSSNLTVDQGLEYAKLWSTSFLVSEDLREGVMAFLEKRDPKFNE